MFPVQCGGRKTYPRARNQFCYYFSFRMCLCVRSTLLSMASMEMLYFRQSLWIVIFGFHICVCLLETFCSFTTLHLFANEIEALNSIADEPLVAEARVRCIISLWFY